MPPQPLPSRGMEGGRHQAELPGLFLINLKTELAFNASENKTKTDLAFCLCSTVRTSLHSVLP